MRSCCVIGWAESWAPMAGVLAHGGPVSLQRPLWRGREWVRGGVDAVWAPLPVWLCAAPPHLRVLLDFAGGKPVTKERGTPRCMST